MRKLTLENKKSLLGLFFTSPWIIGVIVFFLYPLISTIRYSFSEVSFSEAGLVVEPLSNWFENFVKPFVEDTDFLKYFTDSLQRIGLLSPCIVFFSLFIAIMLNQKFIGRTFMRSMFFLPFILATGLVTAMIKQSLTDIARGGDSSSNLFNPALLMNFLLESEVPAEIVNILSILISNMMDLVWQSGLQVIIFLVGLLAIPEVYYEVAKVEGSTAWETFWKVTFPLISPFLLVSLIYTIIDLFTAYDNKLMQYIVDAGYKNFNLSYMSAMFWIYFIAVMIIVGIVYALCGRKIHYDR